MKNSKCFSITFFILLFAGFANAATIKGTVTDSRNGNSLAGAMVKIENTSLSAKTDSEGRYIIYKLPPGTYAIKFTWLGFKEADYPVTIIQPDQIFIRNAELQYITPNSAQAALNVQAQGRLSAINRQLSSDAMVNAIDGIRIREMPDQNAAESIALLPGITVHRNAGEGAGIGIRGFAPQYNQIQVDGVAMPTLPDMGRALEFGHDRITNLSMFSQDYLLSGIDVYKTITPDMDAAAFGGTVNLRLGKAPVKSIYEARIYGAYNQYEDDLKQYKGHVRMSRRYFNDKLGIQLSANAEQRNRGFDRLSGDIIHEDFKEIIGGDTIQTLLFRTGSKTSITNTRSIRKRQSVNAIFDYSTPGTELLFSNLFDFGQLTSKEISRTGATPNLKGSKSESKSYTISNALRGAHDLSNFKVEWQVSHSKSETKTPDDYEHGWQMKDAYPESVNRLQSVWWELPENTPEKYLELLPDDGYWEFYRTYERKAGVGQTQVAGKIDITYPFYFNKVSGFFKMGGKVSRIERESSLTERDLQNGRFPSISPVWSDYRTDYNPDPVLNSRVTIRHFFDVDKIKPVWTGLLKDYILAQYEELKYMNPDNYDVRENVNAGYVMMKLNVFKDLLTLIPGVRYEGEEIDGRARFLYRLNGSLVYDGIKEDRNAKHSEGYWLPMVHLKVKPVPWFDTRLALTKTISSPNYRYRLPYLIASWIPGTTLRRGEPDLKTATSWNYDWSTSFYNGKFGLFTIAGFYKEIRNLSFEITQHIETEADAVEHGLDLTDLITTEMKYWAATCWFFNRDLSTPENTHGLTTVKGIEVDYQANLCWLPGLLKNMTFNINYTRSWSKSWLGKYEVTRTGIKWDPVMEEIVDIKVYDTGFRRGPMISQPDHILNTAVGYDIGGFSGRFSLFYQSESLSNMGDTAAKDTYARPFWQYNVSLRYQVNDHLSFLAAGTNLTGTAYIARLQGTDKNSIYQAYGAMVDFGIELNL